MAGTVPQYTIPISDLAGDANLEKRKQLFRDGGSFDRVRQLWVCPSREVWLRYAKQTPAATPPMPSMPLAPPRLPSPPEGSAEWELEELIRRSLVQLEADLRAGKTEELKYIVDGMLADMMKSPVLEGRVGGVGMMFLSVRNRLNPDELRRFILGFSSKPYEYFIPPPQEQRVVINKAAAAQKLSVPPLPTPTTTATATPAPLTADAGQAGVKVDAPAASAAPEAVKVEIAPEPVPEQKTRLSGLKLLEFEPSILVLQSVGAPQGVRYITLATDVEDEVDEETQQVIKRVQVKTTQKTVRSPEEHARGVKLGGELRSAMRKLGRVLMPGVVMVPKKDMIKLERAIAWCREKTLEYNTSASYHYINCSISLAAIMGDGEEEARQLAGQLQSVSEEVKAALLSCDVQRIRNVANNARSLAKVVPKSDSEALLAALEQAKGLATWIREELDDKGRTVESIKADVAQMDLKAVNEARFAFAEYAGPVEMEPVKASGRFASLDEPLLEPVKPEAKPSGRFDL